MAISERLDADRVAYGLTAFAAHQDGPVRAAVALLIKNGWHRIPAFRTVILQPEHQSAWFVVRWSHARQAFDEGRFAGIGGSRAGEILDFAIALGENRFGLNLQGDVAAGDMIEALAAALGATRVEYEFSR